MISHTAHLLDLTHACAPHRKRYDACSFFLEHAIATYNDGTALDPRSDVVKAYFLEMARRAIKA